jgi:hypothetical protein
MGAGQEMAGKEQGGFLTESPWMQGDAAHEQFSNETSNHHHLQTYVSFEESDRQDFRLDHHPPRDQLNDVIRCEKIRFKNLRRRQTRQAAKTEGNSRQRRRRGGWHGTERL